MNRTITLNDTEPAPLSLRWPLGINLDLRVTMRTQRNTPVDPTLAQFVLLPRSQGGVRPYDMQAFDIPNGIARVEVPGTALMDQSGYNIELYSRQANAVPGDPPLPVALVAKGVLSTHGAGYTSHGPLGLINVPVVVGPPGPTGATGMRGSLWFTGSGVPGVIAEAQPADMYLDEDTGDVYRYANGVWTRGTF